MTVPTPPRPLRILQISDPHLFAQRGAKLLNVDTDASACGVIRHIRENESKLDAVLATGDIAQDGSATAYQRFLELVQPLAPVVRGLPGNHDDNEIFYDEWSDHAQAVTDIGRWRLVLLDSSIPRSSAGHVAPDQLDLLHSAISSAGDRHVLVAVHHNPVPIGSLWLDTMLIDNGHELLGMLGDFPNVRCLIWGHVHQEFDSVYNFGNAQPATGQSHTVVTDGQDSANNEANKNPSGSPARHHLRLLATPATCVQFTPRSSAFSLDTIDPGYRTLELFDDGSIQTTVVRVPGLGIEPDTHSEGY